VDERDLSQDLVFALHLADVASAITMRWFGHRLPVELKEDDTPVTEVDRAVERAIREEIASAFPGDGVLGEEEGLHAGTNGRRWLIDPVDGTKLFAEGIPLWTTLIGLREGDRVVVGVADAPALGDRYHATRGGGAWRDERRLRVSEVAELSEAFVVHSGVEEWVAGERDDSLLRVASKARRTRGLSDAWAQLLVAQGSAELLMEHEPCFEWDWGATSVIVEEAGGRLSTFAGGAPNPGQDLLVTNGLVHDETLGVIAGGGSSSAAAAGGSAPRRARTRTS
jgi:histidinol-phosphatase